MRRQGTPGRLGALLGLLVLAAAGCQPARRYPAPKTAPAPKAAAPARVPVDYAWLPPAPPASDLPVVFVAADANRDEWQRLPQFWNHFPPPAAGTRTAHLGQSPLGAAVALLAMDRLEQIKVKVPLGLPDPTPFFPPSNPPTYARWRLGKLLFFDPELLPGRDGGSCARCHDPEQGFTTHAFRPDNPLRMDPPSLLNCAYNRLQFWDGRATALEEVVFHDLKENEAPPGGRHSWAGIIPRLRANKDYRGAFRQVFGIAEPTEDAVARALATYLRTLLSGNSPYDRARQLADKRRDKELKQEDFEAVLDEATLAKLAGKGAAEKAVAARRLLAGYGLFQGEAGCARCHGGWAFTDADFHNVGIRESDYLPRPGAEPGRFRRVPVGLKESRLIGAFRTPTLRNLPRTGPYFHDGSAETLEDAVQYFNRGLDAQFNLYLDPYLLTGPKTPRRLELHPDDVRALALFLRSLGGEPPPPVVSK
jgi:cytochrome c peroxidase